MLFKHIMGNLCFLYLFTDMKFGFIIRRDTKDVTKYEEDYRRYQSFESQP